VEQGGGEGRSPRGREKEDTFLQGLGSARCVCWGWVGVFMWV
jgi:hypothetical protein